MNVEVIEIQCPFIADLQDIGGAILGRILLLDFCFGVREIGIEFLPVTSKVIKLSRGRCFTCAAGVIELLTVDREVFVGSQLHHP